MRHTPMYIGTYSVGSDSDGIYHGLLDQETGRLNRIQCVASAANPSFLCVSADGTHLFAVSELSDGVVSAYHISPDGGSLGLINTEPSRGGAPCYVSLLNNHLLTANYLSGTVAAFPIGGGGRLASATSVVQHVGTGPNADRQECAHAHSIVPIPDTNFLIAADLGTDELITYRLTPSGDLIKQSVCKAEAGAGPRHIAFHPSGSWLFVLNELNNTLVLYRYDKTDGSLCPITSLSTLPDHFTGDSIAADVHISTDGRFVYCTNRGHESIGVFEYSAEQEALERVQIIGCGGEHPRNFMITPNGRFLLCANQNTHNIVTFAIDQKTGLLSTTGTASHVPMPVCLCLC